MLADPTTYLVVDDEEAVWVRLKDALAGPRAEDHAVWLKTGEAAIGYLTKCLDTSASSGPPFLVFLDLRLPGMSGFEVLDWIRPRRALARMLVIVLANSLCEDDCERAFEKGAFSCLEKYPDPADLIALHDVAKARALTERNRFRWPVGT